MTHKLNMKMFNLMTWHAWILIYRHRRVVLEFYFIFVTLGSDRDKRRLKMSRGKGFLKGFFKRQGSWGLPQ